MSSKKRIGKKIAGILLAAALIAGLIPGMSMTAYALKLEGIELTNVTAKNGYLSGFDLRFKNVESNNAGANGMISIQTQQFDNNNNLWSTYKTTFTESKNKEDGDFTPTTVNRGFVTWNAPVDGKNYFYRKGTVTNEDKSNPWMEISVTFAENVVLLNGNQTYYVYLWTYYGNYWYPDYFMGAITVSDGNLIFGEKTITPDDVTPASAEVTKAPTAKTGIVADGTEQELITEGAASNGTMQYALGTDSTTAPDSGWSTNIPTGTEAKTYYVWYKAVGNEGYDDTTPECVAVTIAAKESGQDSRTSDDTSDKDTKDNTDTTDNTGSYAVSGLVKNEKGEAVEGATVTITPDNYTATTDADGKFAISGLSNGSYNICVEKNGKKITTVITVSGKNYELESALVLSEDANANNSEVEVGSSSGDIKVSKIVVSGMDALAQRATAENATYTMKVYGKNYEEVKDDGGSTITEYANQAYAELGNERENRLKFAWLDMSIFKNNVKYDTTANRINVMEIIIPYDMTNKYSPLVWRCHDGQSFAFTNTTSDSGDGNFYVEGDGANARIHLFSDKFSTYALTYSTGGAVSSFKTYGATNAAPAGGGSGSSSGGTDGVIRVDGIVSGGTAASQAAGNNPGAGTAANGLQTNGTGLQAGATVNGGAVNDAAGVAAANGKANPKSNGKTNPAVGASDEAAPKMGDPIDNYYPQLLLCAVSAAAAALLLILKWIP